MLRSSFCSLFDHTDKELTELGEDPYDAVRILPAADKALRKVVGVQRATVLASCAIWLGMSRPGMHVAGAGDVRHGWLCLPGMVGCYDLAIEFALHALLVHVFPDFCQSAPRVATSSSTAAKRC